jgi:hypothetical protein
LPVRDSGPALLRSTNRVCEGPAASISDLRSLPYRALVPNAPEANRSTVEQVQLCRASALIRFKSGLVLASEPGTSRNPDQDLRRFVAHDRIEASLATVLGHTAAAIGPSRTANASVTFTHGSATFWLIGNRRLSASELVRIANTAAPVR